MKNEFHFFSDGMVISNNLDAFSLSLVSHVRSLYVEYQNSRKIP
jgi:hypothetical protein